jgi:hypothetical protein
VNGLSAKEIVEGLTVKQRTEALIGFVGAVLGLDQDESPDKNTKNDRFITRMIKAAEATERMLSEVPT